MITWASNHPVCEKFPQLSDTNPVLSVVSVTTTAPDSGRAIALIEV